MSKAYTVAYTEDARQDLANLPKLIASQVQKKLHKVATVAEDYPHEELKGDLTGYFRVKVGHYRVIYEIKADGQQLLVMKIGHRKDVYE